MAAVRKIIAPKPKPKSTRAGREILSALAEVRAAILSGDPFRGMTVREVEIPEPSMFDSKEVRELRTQLGVSVAVFARLVGVSAKLVEHWEQGRRVPSAIARRLFDRIKTDPAGYVSDLVKMRRAS